MIDSVENDKVASWFNDSRAIVLAIQRQPDANTVEVVDMVRASCRKCARRFRPRSRWQPLFDRSISIRAAVIDVQETLAIAIALVIMVIFLFLRKVSATIIPALAVPVSLIGTCAAMYAFGFSINNMTLLALTLSVGFVVDDAIVMLENIVRHIEGGMRPFEAALKGSREIGFTIVSITFSLIAVFIPVLLMGGMVGRVFREFAVSIAVAIIVSGFVSLTLTPMLCARVLKQPSSRGRKAEFRAAHVRAAVRGLRSLQWTLDCVLAYKSDHADGDARYIVGTIWLYIIVPKGFFPTEDTGYVIGITEGATDIAFPAMVAATAQGGGHRARGSGSRLRELHGRRRRPQFGRQQRAHAGRAQAAQRARQPAEDPGAAAQERQCRAGHRRSSSSRSRTSISAASSTKSQYQYTLQSNDTDALYRIAPELRDKISKIPGLLDVTTDLYVNNPQVTIDVDREKAAVYGVTVDQVRQELYNAFGMRQVATIYTPGELLSGHSREPPEFQSARTISARVYLKTTNGTTVPLSAVTPLRAHRRPVAGQSPGPAAGGDDLVQSGARAFHSARRSTPYRSSSAKSACRQRSRPDSRAPRRCSRIRCAGRAS